MDFGYEKDSKERLPFEHYLKAYQDLNPEDISQRTGIPYDGETSSFTLRLMGVTYRITHPGYEVFHLDGEGAGWFPLEEKPNARILVLRFLTEGAAAPAIGKSRGARYISNSFRGDAFSGLRMGLEINWRNLQPLWIKSEVRS